MAGSKANRDKWIASRNGGDTVEPLPLDPATGKVSSLFGASENHLGEVGLVTNINEQTFTKPASAVQYTIGDFIGNNLTANLVTPLSFPIGRIPNGSGRLTGCRATVAPASGNLVTAGLSFELLIFDTPPFAAGSYPADNDVLTLTTLMYRHLIALFSFSSGSWRGPLGNPAAAGNTGYQAVAPSTSRPFAPYTNQQTLTGIVQAIATWNPGNIVNDFFFTLESDGN